MLKRIKKYWLIAIVLLLTACAFPVRAHAAAYTVSVPGYDMYDMAQYILNYTNQERRNAGLSELTMDRNMTNAAMQRAAECQLLYSHTRPDGSSCFTVFDEYNCSSAAGYTRAENINNTGSCRLDSFDTKDGEEIVNAWMNSSGHRANILNSAFKSIGIGAYYTENGVSWVQIFSTLQGSGDNRFYVYENPRSVQVSAGQVRFYAGYPHGYNHSCNSIILGECIYPAFCYGEFNFATAGKLSSLTSSDPSVISVDPYGRITGLKPGTVTLTASMLGCTAQLEVTCSMGYVEDYSSCSVANGLKLSWNQVPGSGYDIYRNGELLASISGSENTSYVDTSAIPDRSLQYYVKVYDYANGVKINGPLKYLHNTRYVPQPQKFSVSNTSEGIRLTWTEVDGAVEYIVYRKSTASGSWAKLGSTSSPSYINKSAVNGKKYYYTVKAQDRCGYLSAYAGGKGLTRVGQPQISSISAVSDGIKLTWSKVPGATKYYVYRKTSSSGSWARLGSTTSLSYTNKSAEYGRKYYYTVKAASSDGTLSAYAGGKGMIRLKKPVISSISNTSSGIKFTWAKVAGASKYNVYRKTSSGYTKIGSTTSLSYTNGSVSSGTKYYYTVKAVSSDGILSPAASIKELIRFSQPAISSISNTADGIKLSWSKVPGAAQYYVYRKTSSGWVKLGSTTSLSYTNKSVSSGTKYSYAIKTCTSSGLTQSCFSSSKALTRLSQPVINTLTKSTAGVKITWGKVAGAHHYYVYRKTGSSKWTKLCSTTSLAYTDKTAVKGTKYYYTVQAFNSDGTVKSSYYVAGKAITR